MTQSFREAPALSQSIVFKPIDLKLHRNEVLSFREDAFVCSFGEIGRTQFHQESGPNGATYISWLESKLAQDPGLAVHAWKDERIIGQMELGVFKSDPSVGFVNLYYLIPEARGSGLSKELDQYAVRFLKSKGHKKARLSVSPTNLIAVHYYTRMGWKDLGARADAPELHFMEKDL